MKSLFASLLFSVFFSFSVLGQAIWQPITRASAENLEQSLFVKPAEGRYYQLDLPGLIQQLSNASQGSFTLPLPDGSMQTLQFKYDPVMEPALQARYPEIATFAVWDARNPSNQGRIDFTPKGFHAILLWQGKTVMIDPAFRDRTDVHAVYYQDSYWADPSEAMLFECQSHIEEEETGDPTLMDEIVSAGMRQLSLDYREYRIAIATTAEYTFYHGNTLPLVLAELAIVINRTNFVFSRDAGVRIKLIADNDKIIFFDTATDGYTNGNAAVMINENPGVISQKINLDNYDVGHVFGTFTIGPAIGIAQTPSVCTTAKARGASNGAPPIFDPFVINVFCHELGHQFSAQHSFNKCDDQNENLSTGWEPGSGSTIMSYNGSCGNNNVQAETDPYFHTGNIAQIRNYTRNGTGSSCGVSIPTTNNAPVIDWPYENGFFIPISTPFVLSASASDEDNDNLTYSWEQMDVGVVTTDAGNPVGNSPLFRSFPPSTSPTRYFPQLFRILSGVNTKFEVLPTYSRDMTFRFTVRDNNPEVGGVDWETIAFKATELAGPFTVAKFNTVDSVYQGDYVEVTWNVANTNQPPVNCQIVNIRLSLDGGFTYPFLLAEAVPNTGSFFVTIPVTNTTSGRIMVEAADNIFFDISNGNLRVNTALNPGFSIDARPYSQIQCIPNDASVSLKLESLLNYSGEITLSVESGLPDGAVVQFSQNPVVAPANVTMTIDLSNATETGLFEIVIKGEASGVPVLTRSVFIDVYRGDYSTLDAIYPLSGSSSIATSPTLSWVPQQDAISYTVELATSPAFGASTLISQSGITATSYQPPIVLDESTLFFWRVIPENICGPAEDVPVFAFHTFTLSCAETTNSDVLTIPGQGTHIINSPITLSIAGSVGTLRVKNVTGSHQNFGHLRGNLKGPDGTSVRLFSSKCFQISGNFLFSVNDDSPIPFTCPPDKGDTYKSQEALSQFAGKDLNGTWTLVIEDILSGSGGQLNEWTLEYCSDVALNPPYLANKDTLLLKPGESKIIPPFTLLSEDPDDGPAALVYTLVQTPLKGTLLKAGIALSIGDQFTQQDIFDGLISYQHGSAEEEQDEFLFTVEDGKGGWYGIEDFQIRTDNTVSFFFPNPITTQIHLWPNPSTDVCFVHVPDHKIEPNQSVLINHLGQPIPVRIVSLSDDQLRLDTSGLPNGMYFLQMVAGGKAIACKLQVTR